MASGDPQDPSAATTLVDALVTGGPARVAPSEPVVGAPMLGPFRDLGLLGQGAMGEVRRVFDAELNRVMAMKILRPSLVGQPEQVARFLAEAQATAQLQHPGIVPVHHWGRLDDGRCFFTMKEVRGRTLQDGIDAVHAASSAAGWEAAGGWTFRRLVAAFRQVCDAVAYAHGRGVVHCDLKPANVMVGEHGEVLVMDWGIAKVLGGAPDAAARPGHVQTGHAALAATRDGQIAGTPAFMAPEQARGEFDAVDARSDVWALGAILFAILYQQRPYHGLDAEEALSAVREAPPAAPLGAGPPVPAELEAVRARAMAHRPEDRYPDAGEVAREVGDWLDGVRRREKARRLVALARQRASEPEQLRERAANLRTRSETLLAGIPAWAPEVRKLPAWEMAEEAQQLDISAHQAEVEVEQALLGALGHDPDLVEAHEMLAQRYRARHEAAEAARRHHEARLAEAQLRVHTARLPAGSAARSDHEAWLEGAGRLTLETVPPGVPARLFRYRDRFGRLVARLFRDLGPTPLEAVPLPAGSYRLDLTLPGGRVVHYPVLLGRLEHHQATGPDGRPRPLALPDSGDLGPDACFVPAGPTWRGGDPEAVGGGPRRLAWVDSFVISRFPVTNAEYIAFLDSLVEEGRPDEALRHAPREKGGTIGEVGALIYGFDGRRFSLRPDADGDVWLPDWPVVMVDHVGATAYAAWLAARAGLPWRLPTDAEWGKAARGVDGRFYPWGDGFDPSWCRMVRSQEGQPLPVPVDSYPVDESPYGVRGLGGNVRDWCADKQPDTGRYINRGGYWIGNRRDARSADRHFHHETHRVAELGFRLARSLS